MTRCLTLTALLLSATALIGCDEDEPETCEELAQRDASLELGTGEDLYEALEDGDPIYAVHGPQGGSHAWVGARATGIDPGEGFGETNDGPQITWTLWYGDTYIGEGSSASRLLELDGAYQVEGQMLFLETWDLDLWEYGEEPVYELEVTLVAELEDACGTVLTTERELTLVF